MDCPICRSASTNGVYRASAGERRIALRPEVHRLGVAYDQCPSCGGVLIDRAALRKLDHAAHAAHGAAEDAWRAFQRTRHAARHPDDAPRTLRCPRCSEELIERAWSSTAPVQLDVCPECEGVWLDAGELEALVG